MGLGSRNANKKLWNEDEINEQGGETLLRNALCSQICTGFQMTKMLEENLVIRYSHR
jgi:hypothetical protein